jgi:urease accessory protein
LEVQIQAGNLADEQALEGWLEAEIIRGSLRLEAASLVTLANECSAWVLHGDAEARLRLVHLDGWLLASRDAAELRAQQRQMGQSLLQLLVEMGHSLPAPLSLAWPASWAWASRALKVSDREMVQGYLYSWVANQLSAAVRLLPLGPSRAQVLQQRALPLIADQAEQLLEAHPQTLWSSGVGVGHAQLAHAELYSRLFRS